MEEDRYANQITNKLDSMETPQNPPKQKQDSLKVPPKLEDNDFFDRPLNPQRERVDSIGMKDQFQNQEELYPFDKK